MSSQFPMPFGAYALMKALGQGAMGDVCLARPYNAKRGIPTPVVIKRLHGELSTNPDFVRRFQHEAEIAVSVDSPHVAKVYDVGKVGETLYITMEHIHGWPLSKLIESVIASGRHASVGSIIDMMAGGLEGLSALHTAKDIRTGQPLGVVHRDISPKNLMVGEDGKMRLIDLGLGKSNVQDWKTATGVVMGSVGYMPPEQVTADKVDQRADIYSMAVVLFELLALRHYVPRGPIPVMLRNSLAPTYTPITQIRPDVPPGLDEVLRKALAHDPADRFQTAADMLKAVRAVVPDRRSAGSMAALIIELFGPQLAERKAELAHLLSMPLPELEADEPEPEPTVTYVMAPGVAPMGEDDGPKVRDPNAPPPQPMVQPTPGGTGMWPAGMPQPHMQGMVPRSPDEMGAGPMAEAMFSGYPSASLQAPASTGVPVWAVGVLVVAALIVGVLFASIARAPEDDAVVTSVALTRPLPSASATPSASAQPVAVGVAVAAAPDAGVAPTPASPSPVRSRPPQGSVAPSPSTTAPPPPPPSPTAPPAAATPEAVRELAGKLMQRANGALAAARAANDADKTNKLQAIVMTLTMESGSSDFERSARVLRKVEGELDAIK